jgi:hypothetical protein
MVGSLKRVLILALGLTLALIVFSACVRQAPVRPEFFPERALWMTIGDLNGLVPIKPRMIPKDGVKVTGTVRSIYRGGPVGKELLGLSGEGFPEKPQVYCLRVVPPGEKATAIGDTATVGGFLAPSSAKDNIFLDDCVLIR